MVEDEKAVYTDPDGKVWHPHRGYWCWKVSSELAQAQERIKELEAQIADRARVKPLEWEEIHQRRSDEDPSTERNGGYEADSTFGYYEISMGFGSDTYYWTVSGPLGNDIGSDFDDPSDAKAAAQADYARRILSALEATPPAPKVTEGHPMQPVVVSEHGIHRFKSNKCVEALLDHGQKTGFGLNELARQEHTAEDRMQLAQLIGYSVSGYGDLSYVSDASYDLAAKQSQTLTAAQEAGK